MFKDFEAAKLQLSELAEVINKFKSEAVQLRLIDILFKAGMASAEVEKVEHQSPSRKTSRKKARKNSETENANSTNTKKKASTAQGAVATLLRIYEDGFFNSPRTIGDICGHSETNLARRIKPNEISGKLARMVRDGGLTRTKNGDGQYQYVRG